MLEEEEGYKAVLGFAFKVIVTISIAVVFIPLLIHMDFNSAGASKGDSVSLQGTDAIVSFIYLSCKFMFSMLYYI